jgi:regulator of sigma E protease
VTLFLSGFDPLAIVRAAGPFIGILLVLVVVHEFGHFLAAKALGIKVLEFGVGFPPRAFTYMRRNGTEYTVNWLPIGGFVRLLGEEDPTDPQSLAAAARWKRLTVLFAGVGMNFVLAILLMTVSYMVPRERSLSMAEVTSVSPGSPAATAQVTTLDPGAPAPAQGLQPGDVVTRVNGSDIHNTGELVYQNRLHVGETQDWTIERGGQKLKAEVYARLHPPAGQGATGITIAPPTTCSPAQMAAGATDCELLYPKTERVAYAPWTALTKGTTALWDTVILTKNELQIRFGGGGGGGSASEGPAFQGPVGIASATGQIIQEDGWRSLIELSALLSLNLAVFNVLPIPMLDGGRIFIVLLEIVRGGRRIAPEKEALVHLTGFALLMALVVVVTFFDISRLVT